MTTKLKVSSTLTTEAGAPVPQNQHAQTAGPTGPVLLQDFHLLEKLARFNRERIPERVVHAVGAGAHGHFEVTNPDLAKYTKMKIFADKGKTTEVFARFSTVAGSRGAADTARDPRGFALKFYTEDGNWDLVGNNTPTFFVRDGIKFPDFIHSQKYDPYTNRQEPNNIWDFFSRSPEATHQFTILFGDRGIPASLRNMDGFGSHTFQWVNAAGERRWVKFHFKTDQGIKNLTSEEAAVIGGQDPQPHIHDLYKAIETGNHPSWTAKVQIMTEAQAATYRFNPFDLTKVWSQKDFPLIEIGKLVLDRTPENFFADTEQSAFDPGHFVPGIGPSPDRMLQARLFAYGDAARYRLGTNLMLSAYHGHGDAVRALVARGASVDRPNDRRQTPLAGAAFKGDLVMMAILLDAGAAVDGHGGDGKTALMFAAMFDRVEAIDLLLARGATIEGADASGLTALALARGMGAQRAAARLAA